MLHFDAVTTSSSKQVHHVPKKECTKLITISPSNLNRFSKFFHCWKEKEISNKDHSKKSYHTLRMLTHYFGKVKNLPQFTEVNFGNNIIFNKIQNILCLG